MTNFKEIVTKAVIGKAKKISHGEYRLIPDEVPNTVLGCWIINHTFNGKNENGKVMIDGSFDINVWYSYDDDTKTKVSTSRYRYNELLPVTLKDNETLNSDSQIIVRSLRQPTVTDVNIVDNEVVMNVEKEMGVEVVGDTKLRITVKDEE
jgi:spore coat protein E